MSLSLARFPYISSGMIFAGLSSPTVHVALSSISTASYTMPSNLKGRDRIGRIRKMAAFTGAAGLFAQIAFGNDPIDPFYGTKRPFTRIGANGYPIHNTFDSGEPAPSRTSGRRGRGGSSSRDASLDGFRGRNYHLRSHTRASNDNGLPPGEDPQGDPPLPSVSGGPGPPSRPSSPTAPHAPIQGSGPPPPPPPPPSITSEVDNGKPLSVTLNIWGPLSIIFIFVLLYNAFRKRATQVAFHKSEARSNTKPPFRTPTTGHAIPLAHESSIRQHSHVCSTSLAEVLHFCIRPSFVASHPPSMLKGFLASFRDYIVPVLPLIILYLLSVICCLSGLFEDSEKATVSHEQLALNLDEEEMQEHIYAQSNWSTDASLEIGRVDVDEFLVPMLDDIKASLFAKWTIVDTELHDGADFLHDNAFLENSTSTDWDDLVDDGTFLQETACSLDFPISGPRPSPLLFSPCPSVQEVSSMSFFGVSTPRPNTFNSQICGNTGSKSNSVSESSTSISSYETPTHPPAYAPNARFTSASGSRAHCASIHAPQIIDADVVASSEEDPVSLEEPTPSPLESSAPTQGFDLEQGYRRRRRHRRRSKNKASKKAGSDTTGPAADELA